MIKLKENEKSDKYLDLARELKKTWNSKVTVIPVVTGVGIGTGGLGNYYIITIGQNTEKSPGDLMRLAVSQTLVRSHLMMLM